uniref:Brachyury-like protein n=1 Tax=Magallana gigas TaxID=29159 RepID=K1PYY2_MAGGI
MFPYVEFSLRGVDPVGLYDVIFDIIPASSKSFKFLNNKWIPIGRKEEEFKNYPFKHPDSPRIGSDWMTRKISFEKVKLSNKPGTKAGIFTLHTLQKYLVRISIVKHERDDELSVVEFPIRATTFIAVTAYNNREVTKLKINSNPYSKGFRFPMKRCPLDLSSNKEKHKTDPTPTTEDVVAVDKSTQTEITMADIRSWSLEDSSEDPVTETKEIEKEKNLASQTNERERGKREERLMEYNARIEMWKRDRDTSRSDNPEAMKK